MTRWTRAALVAAALVLAPTAAQSFPVPAAAQAAGYGDDGYWEPGTGGGADAALIPGRRAAPVAEWGTEPDPGPGPDPGYEAGGNEAGDNEAGDNEAGDNEAVADSNLCRPGTPPNARPTTQVYNADPLLGPALLPTASPVGPLLAGYGRFDGLTQSQFLQEYTNSNNTRYVYPPADGFALDGDDQPIKTRQELLPGYRLDRFGNPGGQFLSPIGTPFSSRALPPANLITPENAPLANYHVYCVVKPFDVDSGPIAPWFAQPGWGTQYKLNAAYLPEAGSTLTVTWLLRNGFLVEEDLTESGGVCDRGVARRQREADSVMC